MTPKKRIKTARVQLDLTQEQLAKRLGIERSTRSKWENDIGKVSFENVQRLCKVLNIKDINELRGDSA